MRSGLAVVTAYAKGVSRPTDGNTPTQEPATASPVPNDSGYQGPGSFERLFEMTDKKIGRDYRGRIFTPEAADELWRVQDEIGRLQKIGKAQEEAEDDGIHDTFRAYRRLMDRRYQLYIETNEKGTR